MGLIAGYAGGKIDEALMRLTDMFLAFPALVLAMGISAALGASLANSMIAIAVVWWPWYARLVRGQTLRLRHEQFVDAARAIGRERRPHDPPPHPAELLDADHRPGHARRRLRHPHDGQPLLHRVGRAAADAGVGSDGRHRQGLHPRSVVDGDISRAGHLPGGDGLQSPGRWLAGSAFASAAAAIDE